MNETLYFLCVFCFVCLIRELHCKLTLYVCKQLLDSQLTTALVPTAPSLCFLVPSATITKVRETYFVIRFVISELLSEVVGHGLVLAWFESCVLCLVLLDTVLYNSQDK